MNKKIKATLFGSERNGFTIREDSEYNPFLDTPQPLTTNTGETLTIPLELEHVRQFDRALRMAKAGLLLTKGPWRFVIYVYKPLKLYHTENIIIEAGILTFDLSATNSNNVIGITTNYYDCDLISLRVLKPPHIWTWKSKIALWPDFHSFIEVASILALIKR